MAVERCLSLLLFFSISLTFPLVEGVYSMIGNSLVPLQVPILDVGGKMDVKNRIFIKGVW